MKLNLLHGVLLSLCILSVATRPAAATDHANFTTIGMTQALNVVSAGGTGSVVQATLRLNVLAHGSNNITYLCQRGGDSTNGFTLGACDMNILFADCFDVVASIAPREDGSNLNDSQFTCGTGTCVEVSGYLLGAPQTGQAAVMAVVDSVSASSDCSAR